MIGLKRLVACLAVLVLGVAALNTAPSPPAAQPATPSLAGQLLIASSEMDDPRFAHAVILVVRHDQTGALGIMINRPTEERSIAELLEATGKADTSVTGSIAVCLGGPVETNIGFVIHSADYRLPGSIDIDGHVVMTTDPQILRDIGHGRGPKQRFFAFGYTGWGPGQLEDEMARQVWFTAEADQKLIFDTDRDEIWSTAMSRRTRDL